MENIAKCGSLIIPNWPKIVADKMLCDELSVRHRAADDDFTALSIDRFVSLILTLRTHN